jgi:hypothetical protein
MPVRRGPGKVASSDPLGDESVASLPALGAVVLAKVLVLVRDHNHGTVAGFVEAVEGLAEGRSANLLSAQIR